MIKKVIAVSFLSITLCACKPDYGAKFYKNYCISKYGKNTIVNVVGDDKYTQIVICKSPSLKYLETCIVNTNSDFDCTGASNRSKNIQHRTLDAANSAMAMSAASMLNSSTAMASRR